MTFTQGSNKSSFGKASPDEIKEIGIPVYGGIDQTAMTFMKTSDQNGDSMLLSGTTTDDFSTVDAWYTQQLGSDFQASRLDMGESKVTTFKKTTAGGGEMDVALTVVRKDANGKSNVAISLVSKSKQ